VIVAVPSLPEYAPDPSRLSPASTAPSLLLSRYTCTAVIPDCSFPLPAPFNVRPVSVAAVVLVFVTTTCITATFWAPGISV
jgi:hypothetical protein